MIWPEDNGNYRLQSDNIPPRELVQKEEVVQKVRVTAGGHSKVVATILKRAERKKSC